jgi:hypothetical protein
MGPFSRIRVSRPKWPSQWRVPRYISGIPLPALRLIGLLVLINALVWAVAGVLLRKTAAATSLSKSMAL